ncbi:MAG: hydroxymethylbilane synthase [Chloroflexi bacterium]|nr:hydroxymethylbilane synthase [Chloroflexota bacterium]
MLSELPKLTIGTRTSELALWQTHHIIQLLETKWPGLVCQIEPFVTQGDKTQKSDQPLPEIGGKGVFTAELEAALRAGQIDLAIHSLKDLPVEDAPGLTIGALTSRADVRDVLVAREGWTLATLPKGAVVGTSSTRRAAQLLLIRPDLTIQSIRGNVGTRVRKVKQGDYAATVLAAAGLARLGMLDCVTEWLSLEVMLPAPGQGALAVQCRANDATILALLAALDDADVRAAVTAERAFLHGLGGGCSAPVAAYATVQNAHISLQALVAAPDGRRVVRVAGAGDEATALGEQLAQQALAQGAGDLVTTAKARRDLEGKRIVITRTPDQAVELTEQLTRLGAIPIQMPMIQIVPMPDLAELDQAIQQLSTYNWLIFTSTNTVSLFWERWLAQPQQHLGATKVAAVGSATSAALRQRGIEPDFVPDVFVAEALVGGLGDLTGAKILLPQAEIARAELTLLLTAKGAQVDAIPVYQTLPATVEPAALAALQQGVDAITFTSSSTVRNFIKTLHGDPTLLQQAKIACIGPVTAQTAHELGLAVDIIAEEYSAEGLVHALAVYFQKEHP